jgi:hypothetical protein
LLSFTVRRPPKGARAFRLVFLQLHLADLIAMDLVGPIHDAHRARARGRLPETEIGRDARGAVRLNRPVDDG